VWYRAEPRLWPLLPNGRRRVGRAGRRRPQIVRIRPHIVPAEDDLTDRPRQFAPSVREDVGVDVGRDRGPGVAQKVGQRPDVLARADGEARHCMADAMDADMRRPRPLN